MTDAVDPVRRQCVCGHDRDTHHNELMTVPTPTGGTELARVYEACLHAFCDCRHYRRRQSR